MHLKSPSHKPVHVALTNGHAISIGPEGRDVQAMFIQAAFSNGAIPAEASSEEFEVVAAVPTEESKLELLANGIKKLFVEQPESITGAGLPNRKTLSAVVGWNVSVQELSEAMAVVTEEANQ